MNERKRLKVLLVEDQEIDRMTVKRAFRRHEVDVELHEARDGVEALEVLRGHESQTPLQQPFLILLDLNMPRMGGLEFLDQLRADPDLRRSVVFVLTTSSHERDLKTCYDQGVAGFILKESLGSQSQAVARLLDRYWELVELPH